MSNYHVVYSPDGEFFEVPQHKKEELVLQHGWTQSKPVPVKEVKAASKPAPKKEEDSKSSVANKATKKESTDK